MQHFEGQRINAKVDQSSIDRINRILRNKEIKKSALIRRLLQLGLDQYEQFPQMNLPFIEKKYTGVSK